MSPCHKEAGDETDHGLVIIAEEEGNADLFYRSVLFLTHCGRSADRQNRSAMPALTPMPPSPPLFGR